jgi:hypothetical protein
MTPIAPLITAFLRQHMPIERGYSPNTCDTYAHAFRLLFEFASDRLGTRPSQLCIEHITAHWCSTFCDISRRLDQTAPSPVTRAWQQSRLLCGTSNCASRLRSNRYIRFAQFQRSDMTKPWFNTSR